MHQLVNHKIAIASVLVAIATLVSAQTGDGTAPSTPGSMNSTTSPNPLQTRPVDGMPNSATGTQTPGTGTGSSRTMRNENGMSDTPSGSRAGMGNGSGTVMQSEDMMKNRSNGSTGSGGSNGSTGSMNDTATPMARPARNDRG